MVIMGKNRVNILFNCGFGSCLLQKGPSIAMTDYIFLEAQLKLDRCPRCSIAKPLLPAVWETETTDSEGQSKRTWRVYKCATCGVLVTASSIGGVGNCVDDLYPAIPSLDPTIPERARAYLHQATESLHAPSWPKPNTHDTSRQVIILRVEWGPMTNRVPPVTKTVTSKNSIS
jgi:hypothetical protein